MDTTVQKVFPTLAAMPIAYEGEPFLTWAGGKTQLLPELNRYFPKEFNSYFEPFMGAAAVFFYLRRTRGDFPAWLNDYNPELVNCFEIARDKVDALIPLLRQHKEKHSESYYYRVRKMKPVEMTPLQRAARLIYMNKTCFNGLYRVNAHGEFNVPIGSSVNPGIFDESQLRATSRALQGVKICNLDFSAVLDLAKKGDLVYFDPPYHTDTNGFTGYIVSESGRAGFGASQQRRLSNVVDQLRERGCYVVVSNSCTKFITNVYYDYNVHTVHASRRINSNGNGRGLVKEVIITNYDKNS